MARSHVEVSCSYEQVFVQRGVVFGADCTIPVLLRSSVVELQLLKLIQFCRIMLSVHLADRMTEQLETQRLR